MGGPAPSLHIESTDSLIFIPEIILRVMLRDYWEEQFLGQKEEFASLFFAQQECIRESVDSLCRDGATTPIVCVHRQGFEIPKC